MIAAEASSTHDGFFVSNRIRETQSRSDMSEAA
jgi:hypothetical protein